MIQQFGIAIRYKYFGYDNPRSHFLNIRVLNPEIVSISVLTVKVKPESSSEII